MTTETTPRSVLARYVPRVLAEWDLQTSDAWQELDGTLCYVDISGFTALSEKLARRGRIGAEELTDALNYVFGRMLALAYDRGGSLLKFGGDALLLLFRGSDHPTHACSAAVEMQGALREAASYRTSAGQLHLKMSVGIHSGIVHVFRAGESHRELMLTGPAASMTTEMEETASAGEILISPATRKAIPAGAATSRKGAGWLLKWRKPRLECCGWSPRISLEPDVIAEGVPVGLREYLDYGTPETEHRLATVGFVKFTGVDALMESGGPGKAAVELEDLVRDVQAAVDQEGITFLATDLDQDGGKIILVAGVPGAQEDDEGRMLRAVRRIADRAGELDLQIGVNYGHVFVGEIGTEFRATYTIMGDTVNLAARLMAAAPSGGLLASPEVLDRSRTLFETTALEPFHVKGKDQPVQAYAVGPETGSRAVDRTDQLPFMGRQTEVAALVSAIEHLNEGRGGVVKVIGENGIGKSRLVDQALPALSDVHHINIRSEPYGAATPYRPLRDPLRHLLGVERSSHVQMAEQLESTVKDLDPTLLPMVPLIADVAMVEVDSTPEVDAIEPKFRQDRTADVLVYLFERALAGPILFEAEDGHWMDDASVHVLNRIASVTGEQPWLVLTTRRDEPGGFNPEGTEMRLGPLSEEESRNLVIKAMEAAPLRPHDLDAIVARAGGLPLFLEEIIRAVRRAGAVDALPDSLDAVVAAQIDALPPLPRRLLGYASVLGRSFRIATLNGLIADEQVELDSATRGQLAGFLDLEGTTRLRFRHALFRDVAYEGLSFRRRKELHQRAGELAERAASDDVESVADVLALHFSLAGDAERTWRYARIAGDQARDAYANVEAAVQYERALDGVRRLPSVDREAEAGVWERLGDVRERAGLYEDSVEGFGKAIRLSGNDVHQRAYLLFRRARARLWIGDYQMALRDTSKGLKAVGTVKDAEAGRARAMLSGFRAAIRQFQARPQEALDSALTAVKEAQNVSDDETLARGYLVLDWAYRVLGQPDRAVHLPKALEIYERMDYLPGVAETTMNLGAAAYMDGRWDDAVAWYTRSHDASLESGNQVRAAVAGANMAELLIDQGHLDEADLRLGQAIRVLRASNNAGDSIFAELQAGRLMVERGRCDAAATILERIKSEAASIGEAFSVLEASLELARSRLLAGDAPDGLAILNDARDAAGGVPSHFAARFAYVEALIRIELGEFDEASRILESAIVEADRQGLLFEVALLRTTRADLARRAGVQPDPTDISEAGEIFAQLGVDRSA